MTKTSKLILRAHGWFLLPASIAGLSMDLVGAFLAVGPQAVVFNGAPGAAIGPVEAHGLAFILSLWLLRTPPNRAWHLTGAAIALLLGASNLLFWEIFVRGQVLAVGYASTALHAFFLLLQSFAAASTGASRESSTPLPATASS